VAVIRIVKGDLLKATEDVIAHQVNCRGVMGAGVAKQIRSNFPIAYDHYVRLCGLYKDNPDKLLGICQIVSDYQDRRHILVANLFGQDEYGRDRIYTDENALRMAIRDLGARIRIMALFSGRPTHSIAMPYKIGCGLAGGDWEDIYRIIEDELSDLDVTLYQKE
jgi:O-acetyl-ADP-ribose deacetylase (regulator of RNase III)